MSEVIFTMDVEDPDRNSDGSFVQAVEQVLDWLAEDQRRGTFFIVGELAKRYPSLIRQISDLGHELGVHGYLHVPVESLGPETFRNQTRTARLLLEDLSGQTVAGYRAPMFSLNAQCTWAPDILVELGFVYSSSVLPGNNPRYSYADAPCRVFRWSGGLVEVPAPVIGFGPLRIAFFGGIYFRYLPNPLLRRWMGMLEPEQASWFYCHPYDFPADNRWIRMKDTPLWVNIFLMMRRRGAFQKLTELMANQKTSQTMRQYVAGLDLSDSVYSPDGTEQSR